ncbi:MAG: UDP-N-acetylglucosamine 2-epimerase [Bacillota bacterium]|nr:UDP-N-acetylglucosamine 2-epimerase [Bacillota bacterium]
MLDKKIKVIAVTGTRADYGIYHPILKQLEADPTFDLNLIVTGMHLSPFYGNTIDEIRKDGFKIASTVDILLQGSSSANMSKSVGLGILGMTQVFESIEPDLVLALGDRGEMLSAAIAASHMNIALAHLHGGEVSGSIDESVRHAISKFAHIHFPATTKSSYRLEKMGEEFWRIHTVGAARLDSILKADLPSIKNVKKKYHLNFNGNYYLLVFHPVTTEIGQIRKQIQTIFNVLLEEDMHFIVIKPNSDAGNEEILSFYEEHSHNHKISFVTNFNHLDYLTVLKNSSSLIGNSSSGIIEAASFRVPVINIGERQKGRERSGNVIDTSYDYNDIKNSIKHMKTEEFKKKLQYSNNVYGDGKTSERIAEILKGISFNEKLFKKRLSY